MGTTRTCPTCGETIAGILDRCPKDGAPLFSEEILSRVGMLLKDHEILGVIGEGGMGVVYRAQHVVIEKPVAIKVLHDRFAKRTDMVEQFIIEAKAASRIRHPNIIDLTDFGTTPEGMVFQVMEYLEGESLEDRLDRVGRLPPFEAINIIKQVARGLGAAHELGIVHRDLKPANVFLCQREGRRRIVRRVAEDAGAKFAVEPERTFDFVKLLDFGVAKFMDLGPSAATRNGSLCGTPFYLSPEQAQEKPATESSDLYALGVMLYEMVTGDVPFDGASMLEILNGHVQKLAIPPSRRAPDAGIDECLEAVIMRCLEKRPERRFASTDELCDALANCVTDRAFLRDAHVLPGFSQAGIAVPTPPGESMVTPKPVVVVKEKGFSAVGDDDDDGDSPDDFDGEPTHQVRRVGRETQEIFQPQKSRAGLYVLVGLAVAVVGGAAWYFTRGESKNVVEAPRSVKTETAVAIPTPPPVKPVAVPADTAPVVAVPLPAPAPPVVPAPAPPPAASPIPGTKIAKSTSPGTPKVRLPAGFVPPPPETDDPPPPKPAEPVAPVAKPVEPETVGPSKEAVDTLMKEAQQAWLKAYYAVAIDKAQQVLQADPKRTNAYQIIAVSSCAMGESDAAKKAAAHLDEFKRKQVGTLCRKHGVELE